jgi:hypothetical protein
MAAISAEESYVVSVEGKTTGPAWMHSQTPAMPFIK